MPFRKVPNYIVKARASYQLVRGVPVDIQAKVGKKKWKEPGGKTLSEARSRVPAFITKTDAEIKRCRGEQLTPEEILIAMKGHHPEEMVSRATHSIPEFLDEQGTINNPDWDRLASMAEAIASGEAVAVLSADALLQARKLDRDPAARTYIGWKSALEAFMAFTDKQRPGLCTAADAVAFKDHLLLTKSRNSAKTQCAYLAGLWTTLVAKEGTGTHIWKEVMPTLQETTKQKALKAAETKRFKTFEPVVPVEEWTGSKYVDVFRILYFSGCRLAEVAGLRGEDIHEDHFEVTWQEERSLKTSNSVRDIPIHPAIHETMKKLKGREVTHLWPGLQTTQKVDGVNVIRWGQNLAKPCKKITGLRPKDFRDRVIGQLRSNNFNQVLIERLSGHSATTTNSTYGGADWELYQQMIESIK